MSLLIHASSFNLGRNTVFSYQWLFFKGGGVMAGGCRDDLIFIKEHQSGVTSFMKTPISLLCVTCNFYQYLWPLCCPVLTCFGVKISIKVQYLALVGHPCLLSGGLVFDILSDLSIEFLMCKISF